MVLVFKSNHSYHFDFSTTTLAFYNKYPNPFSEHVISADTISQRVDSNGNLICERLIRKRGRIPSFVRPFFGGIADSWVLETSIVNRENCSLQSWTRNVDHKRFLQVHDCVNYQSSDLNSGLVECQHSTSFISTFGSWGIKDRIETWSYKEWKDRMNRSRSGMRYVMEQVKARGLDTFRQMQLRNMKLPEMEEF